MIIRTTVSALAGAVFGFLCAVMLLGRQDVRPESPTLSTTRSLIRFVPTSYEDVPGWRSEAIDRGAAAFRASCRRLQHADPDRPMANQVEKSHPARRFYGVWSDWSPACAAVADLGSGITTLDWERLFAPFRVHGPKTASNLLTGYFEPERTGSRIRTPPYLWPLRARPRDLVTANLSEFGLEAPKSMIRGVLENDGRLAPYPTRAAMRNAHNDRAGEPILWLAHAADAFYIEIEGSARVRLREGGVLRVSYDADNGHAYQSIGRILIDRGALAPHDADLDGVRRWMRQAGDTAARELMDANPRKVFFKVAILADSDQGPVGALGVPLTPHGSVAVDRAHHALGAAAWIVGTPKSGAPRRGLVAFQDVGDAIRGPVRADYFTGWGDGAEAQAGRIRDDLAIWVFRPRAMGAWTPEE